MNFDPDLKDLMPVDPTGLDELKGYLSCLKIKCPQVRAA
jgi:hypothetical protein